MPTRTMLEFAARDALQRELPREVQRHFGNGAFIHDVQDLPDRTVVARVGFELPDVIEDPSTGEGLLNFVRLRNVVTLEFSPTKSGLSSRPLDMPAFAQGLVDRQRDLIQRAERSLVQAAGSRIVQVQPIGTGLNPLREVLTFVHEKGEMPASIAKGYEKYLRFLASLDYVERRGSSYHPAAELQKFELQSRHREGNHSFYDIVLGEVLQRGYDEISQGLSIQHLVPIVRASNAYYWPSHQYGEPLKFRAKDFLHYLRQHHPGYRISEVKVLNHLVEMDRAGIVHKKGVHFIHDETVWDSYESIVAKTPALAA